jgi:hypothetical protein
MLDVYQFVLRSVLGSAPASPQKSVLSQQRPETSFCFHRHQVVLFLLASALWLLQQTVLCTKLCARCGLSVRELHALHSAFSSFDYELSGEVEVADLPLLFEVSLFSSRPR